MKKRLLASVLTALLVVTVISAVPHLLPSILSAYRPDICFSAPVDEKILFITVDDAPSKNTAAILGVLKKHQVAATFFIIADRAKQPAQLQEITAEGPSLGNHLRTTEACSRLS